MSTVATITTTELQTIAAEEATAWVRASLSDYHVRANDCTGKLLATVTAATVEQAALLAGQCRDVLAHFGRRRGAVDYCGTNRETGAPGKSGVFTLRAGGANKGQIWIG